MPQLSVWMIRTSLLHLGAGMLIGALLLWNKGLPFDVTFWLALPVHIELVLVGWMVQLVLGMAFWIVPRFTRAPRYGNETLGWISFVMLNTGLGVVVVSYWVDHAGSLALSGHILEVIGILIFVRQIWQRVKPFGK